MYLLQPDINISLNRGGSFAVVPSYDNGTSAFVSNTINDMELVILTGVGKYNSSFEVPDWIAGTYNDGDYVRNGTSIYLCNTDGTTSEPNKSEASVDWTWMAYSNKYNALNGVLASRTYGFTETDGEFQDWSMITRTSSDTIEYLSTDGVSEYSSRASKINKIALMNLFQCDTVSITVKKSDNETVIFSETYDASYYALNTTGGWTNYFDTPKNDTNIDEVGNSVIVDIPTVLNGYIEISIMATGTNKMRGVGGVFFGRVSELGTVNYGSESGFTDYSSIEDNDYGEYTFVSRQYKRNFTYNFTMQEDSLNAVTQKIVRNRAYPCVFIGDEDKPETINYGIVKDFSPALTRTVITASLEVTGT